MTRGEAADQFVMVSPHPQVAGFPIFGCAQPTEEGFDSVLAKIPGGVGGQAVRTIWYNMRQEPVVYIDGLPCAPRQPDRSDNMWRRVLLEY